MNSRPLASILCSYVPVTHPHPHSNCLFRDFAPLCSTSVLVYSLPPQKSSIFFPDFPEEKPHFCQKSSIFVFSLLAGRRECTIFSKFSLFNSSCLPQPRHCRRTSIPIRCTSQSVEPQAWGFFRRAVSPGCQGNGVFISRSPFPPGYCRGFRPRLTKFVEPVVPPICLKRKRTLI